MKWDYIFLSYITRYLFSYSSNDMTAEKLLFRIAGSFIVISVALGYFVSAYFYLFTAFVGLNMFQFSFTNFCPMISIIKFLGFKEKKA